MWNINYDYKGNLFTYMLMKEGVGDVRSFEGELVVLDEEKKHN